MARHAPAAAMWGGLALLLAGPAQADDWSSLAIAIFIGYAWLALYAVLLAASLWLGVRRWQLRGAKSALLYFIGAALAPLVGLAVPAMATHDSIPSLFNSNLGIVVLVMLPSIVFWLVYLLAFRLDDARDENRVWKSTR